MIPTSSSSDSNGCNNISSNCVIWQGPDISCINLCNGDTVSDVVAALAEKLCELTAGISNEPDLTGFDLKCALPSGATPTTLVENLQAIITYICSLPTDTGTPYTEPNINLCTALQYESGGTTVTSLPLSQYAELVGNKLCNIIATITTIQTQLTSLDGRVTVLESFFPITSSEAQIIPKCVTSTVGQLTDVSVVVGALETDFCDLRTATGTPAVINNAVGQQAILNGDSMLSVSGQTYSAQTGWKTSPVNMANSLQNAWIVIKDLYDAVATIQTECCPGACDSLVFDFSATRLLDSNSLTTHIILDLSASTIPSGFADTAGTTPVTISDSATPAGTVVTNINLTSLAQSAPYTTNIPVSTINGNGDLTVSINSSFTKEGNVCQESKTKSVAANIPCPGDTASSNITATGFDISFSNLLGTTAVYTVDVMDGSVVAATSGAINNPGGTVNQSFTGLTANTNYSVRITLVYQGTTKVCPLFPVKTADAAPPCNQGIDIVFAFDYSFSMSSIINTAKTAVTDLINTIKTASGHPTYEYRIGLMLYDEAGNLDQTPTYNTASNYTSLPASQRVIQNGTGNNTQFFTAMEMLQTNNETTFSAQLAKLNNGSNLGMGGGGGNPEAGLPAVQQIVSMQLCGAFRTNVAKIIVLLTDETEGGFNDTADAADITLGNNLATVLNTQGIKFIAMGPGADNTTNGVAIYEVLANATGGTTTTTFSASDVATAITNACGGSS